ncbi:MAG TPA: hypothetical protein VH134_11795 [Candidatus Dormibacteraeota bacterium]|jgi:hypothetical protein|nr:hypothetical protein [Candidatus Dormibacteraeota bacterium]
MTFLTIALLALGAQALLFALVGMGLLVRIALRSAPPPRRIEDLMSIAAQIGADSRSRIVALPVHVQPSDESLAA